MKTFFRTLPKRLKVLLHALEIAIAAYLGFVMSLLNTPLGEHVHIYLPTLTVWLLVSWPLVRLGVELLKGVPGTSPDDVDPLSDIKPNKPNGTTANP